MALNTKIDRASGTEWYLLRVENISWDYARKVTTSPLPGNTILQLDLGMSKPSIRITGTCDDSNASQANGAEANYKTIQSMNGWYGSTIKLYTDIARGDYFEGKIGKIDFSREPWMNYWKFSIQFEVRQATIP